MNLISESWMPNCSMKRIILHWTAGRHKASDNDKSHYHIMIEDDGKLVRGTHSIKDNVSTGDNVYAAHVARKNTGSIGVAVCCMQGARERPFNAGDFPMTRKQWEVMAQVTAELCDFYEIDVTTKTVLGHGEVAKYLGVPQGGKWDPMVLPFDTSLSKSTVGSLFRRMVKDLRENTSSMRETPASITANIKGRIIREAQIFNEKSFIKIRPFIETFDLMLLHASKDGVELGASNNDILPGSNPIFIPFKLIDHGNNILSVPNTDKEAEIVEVVNKFGFFGASILASKLNLSISWDGSSRTVTIGKSEN